MANNRLVTTLEAKDAMSGKIDKSTKAIDRLKKSVDDASKSAKGLDYYQKRFDGIMTSMKPVEQKLKQLQRLAADMRFNDIADNDLFGQVVASAGKAKDSIDGAREAISRFGDGQMKINAAAQGFSTLAAAGSSLAGIMGLVGVESDEAAEALLKVQSAMAIMSGFQQIATNLDEDSTLMQRIRQLEMEDAAAQEAGDSIGKLASERLRDANALKGLTSAKSVNAGASVNDAKATGANTSAQALNTNAIISNTGENIVNTGTIKSNTQEVIKNTSAREGKVVELKTENGLLPKNVALTVEQIKMNVLLTDALKKRTITQEQANLALAEYNRLLEKGIVKGAANKAMESVTTKSTTLFGSIKNGASKAYKWLDNMSRAMTGLRLTTLGWGAAVGLTIFALYKLATAKDEYVKELEEEAEKLEEAINKQKNMTVEQTKAKARVEALKNAQERLNRVYEDEKSYIQTIGSTFSNLMKSYRDLRFQYNSLKSSHEKTLWIKNNQSAFESLGTEIKSTVDAEKVFNTNTSNIIEGFKLRAKAAAQAALAIEGYKKAIQLEKEASSTGMRGKSVSVRQANKLPESLRNKLIKDTEERETPFVDPITMETKTETVLKGYRVPFDASESLLNELAKHGMKAVGTAAAAKKEYDNANKLIDQSFETTKQAAKKLGGKLVNLKEDNKPTKTSTKTDNSVLGKMEAELKKLTDQRRNINLNTEGAEKKIKELDKLIKAKEKEISDYKIKVGIDTEKLTGKDGSLEALNKQLTEYQTALKQRRLVSGLGSEEDIKKAVKDLQEKIEKEEIRIGVKTVPESGSVGDLQLELQKIQKRLSDEKLSLPLRAELTSNAQEIQSNINKITTGNVTIPARVEPSMSGGKGDLFDMRKSRENAQTAIQQIQSDFEAGIIKTKEEAQRQIDEINKELKKLGQNPIDIELNLKTKGLSKTLQGISEVGGAAADAFSALGDATGVPELNAAGILAGGIASVIQGYGQATALAANLGPWAWIAFGLAATAQLASMIAAITDAKNDSGFAQGGIVGGNSIYGDKIPIRVNSQEMILNKGQQAKLWSAINNGGFATGGNNFDNPRIVGILRGRDIVLMMENENKIRKKSGMGIKLS